VVPWYTHLLIVDLSSGAVINNLQFQTGISGLAVDTDKGLAVVASMDRISVINTDGGATISTISSGLLPSCTAFRNGIFPLLVPGNPDISDIYFSVDVNMASHIAIVSGSDGFLLIDLDKMIHGSYPLDGAKITLSTAADRDRNSVLLSYLKQVSLLSWTKGIADVQLPNPLPEFVSLAPYEAEKGNANLELTLERKGFIKSSSVSFNGQFLTYSFISNDTIAATVPGSMLQTAGTFPVRVVNPAPNGGTSGSLSFTVLNPMPTLTAISPASVLAGTSDLLVELSGTGFDEDTTLSVNGQTRPTTIVSATRMRVSLFGADLATAGTTAFAATNPSPGAGCLLPGLPRGHQSR
jgi:hypothetical protein